MKRTIKPAESAISDVKKEVLISNQQQMIEFYSALLTRSQLTSRLGYQFSGERDLYEALGYYKELTYDKYAIQYERQDIAKAIINKPVELTWREGFKVEEEGSKDEKTVFEQAWEDLVKKLRLIDKFIRLDKLASLGSYGGLLLGFDDVSNPDGWLLPIKKGKRQLLYVKPLSEGSAKIQSWEADFHNVRYGMPATYNVAIKTAQSGVSQFMVVHHSRIIHVPGEILESEVEGVPVLKVVFNRLMDLEKLVGASAEMFWRGARPGYAGKVDPNFTLTDDMKLDLKNQIDEFEHNLRRFLINEGVDLTALEMQVADPRWHVDVQLQMIAAVTGIPKRILVGSERGELASSEDRVNYLEVIKDRQKNYAESQIVRPFIDLCIEHQVLPKPVDYKVFWMDLFAPSEKERAEIGKVRASALQCYMNNPAAVVVCPPAIFIEYMLGLSDAEIIKVKKLMESADKDFALQIAGIAKEGRPGAVTSPALEETQNTEEL